MQNNSPPYVLAYMADSAGCGYHRIGKPLEALTKAGYMLGRTDFQIWSPENLFALKPDIIIWQRQHEDFQIENMRRSREAVPNAYFVYEIDDILSACPEWSIHKHHIPYDVDDRMAKAIKLCDVVTVTTRSLLDHIKSLCGSDCDVRIVPNMLSREDLVRVDDARQKSRRIHFKPRIGWGGGISHNHHKSYYNEIDWDESDLDLLIPAIEELGDKVEWVFLATKPNTSIPVEFHNGIPPQEYLSKLGSLDLDLMLAPGIDNLFNRCKSNLRLLEGGACKYPIIASPIEPYTQGSPPVYSYAEPGQWLDKIKEFLQDPDPSERGKSLRGWVERHYLFDDHLDERMKAWSPKGVKPFSPKRRALSNPKLMFACSEPQIIPEGYEGKKSLEELIDQDCNIVYLRRGTHVTADIIKDLTKRLTGDIACIVPLTNDGGFPRAGTFVAVDLDKATGLNKICNDIAKDITIQIPFPYGPLMVLSRKAIDLLGFPNILSLGDAEAALTEWGLMATARGFKNMLCCDNYVHSAFPAPQSNIADLSKKLQLRYNIQAPPDPIKDLRVHLELAFFKNFYNTPVPSQNASYDEWYSIFDTLGKKDKIFLDSYEPDMNVNVTYYGTSFEETLADWVCFIDKSSVITDQFVYFFNEAFEKNPDAVFAYADHDFVDDKGKRHKHDFKRHTFDYDFLLGRDYVSQVCAVRTDFLKQRLTNWKQIPVTPNHLYGLALNTYIERGVKGLVHVPRILAHLVESAPDGRSAVERALVAHNISGLTVTANPHAWQYNIVDYASNVPEPAPKVSIIIPTKNRVEMLSPCIESLLNFTDYPNYEVLVIDTGSTEPKALEYESLISEKYKSKLTVMTSPKTELFNWSAVNNWAVRYVKGDYLLFLNNDTRFMDPAWLKQMVGVAVRPHIGAVGAKLLYPSGVVQHVGVIHSNGLVGHIHKMLPGDSEGSNGLAILTHSDTAVTGACLLVEYDKFKEVGGFNEDFSNNFNDVAFCLELNKIGYTNVTVCSAILQHLEGISRIGPGTIKGQHLMRREAALLGKLYPTEDPYWNPNLCFVHTMGGILVTGLNYDLLKWPSVPWPWRDKELPADKVLLIGDDGPVWVAESQEGSVCYLALLNGYNMQIARPTMENLPVFDLRDPETSKKVLAELGINRIVVRSILGGIVEILPFLTSLNYPIEYRPNSAESVCPRIDCRQDNQSCGFGWRSLDSCRGCLASYNSPFGAVQPEMWRMYWRDFIDNTSSVDFSDVPSELKIALREVNYSAQLED